MLDVIIAGAGPAGSIAATVLARAGARVLMIDREAFPRDKLCGDTLNPGAVRILSELGLVGGPLATARPLAGMLVTGPRACVRATYGDGIVGLAITRRDLDAWLLDQAIRAGARFESGFVVRRALVDDTGGAVLVRGLVLAPVGKPNTVLRMPAVMTIAADGRRSSVAQALGLSVHPVRPRRWAFGVYATGVAGITDLGEMHIRQGRYLGIAPIDDDIANVCVVTGPRPDGRTPSEILHRAIARDPDLAERFAHATFVSAVRVLGPLAADARAAGAAGLLLAGDAAGFVDPMTGDGLRLAMQSAVLAAREVLATLESGDVVGAPLRLARTRRTVLGPKLRFNRALRRLVESPAAVSIAGFGAEIVPSLVRRAVRYAGDAV